MAARYRTKGFVFKKIDRNESDRIFSIFTEDFGRLEITAKSVRKITSKLKADIDIFYLSEIEFIQGKNNKTLTSTVKIKRFESAYDDFRKLEVVCLISALLDNFLKGQEKDEKTFELLEEILSSIFSTNQKIKNYQLAFQYFFWNFISLQGYRLQVSCCAVCRGKLNPYNIYFSGKGGGIVCKSCFLTHGGAEKINSDIAKILRLVLNRDWQTVSRLRVGQSSQNLLLRISENAIHTFSPAHS